MGTKSLLRVGYLLVVVQGLLSVVVPKKALKLATVGWRAGFENVDELEPREWYVEVTRISGVGMLAAGATGLLVASARDDEKEQAESESATVEDGDDSDDDHDDDGPITIDIDE